MGARGFLRWVGWWYRDLINFEPSDMIYKWNQKSLSIKGESIKGILNNQKDISESIIGEDQIKVIDKPLAYIGKFGLIILAKYQKVLLSIIKMMTPSITNFQTFNAWKNLSIVECTAPAQKLLNMHYEILRKHVKEQNYGIFLPRHNSGKVSEIQRGNL